MTNLDDIHHPLGLEESHFEFNFSLPAGATTGTGVFVLTPVQDDFVENEETDPDDGVYIQFFPDVGEDVLASVPDDDLPLTSSGTKVILNLIDDDSLGPTATLTRCSSGSGSLVFIDFLDQDLNADPVTGFELSDLVVENGTATALTGSGEEYQATVEVADEFQGELTVTVPFGVAEDADGQVNNAGSCTLFIDKRPPRAAITGPAGGGPVHGPFAVRDRVRRGGAGHGAYRPHGGQRHGVGAAAGRDIAGRGHHQPLHGVRGDNHAGGFGHGHGGPGARVRRGTPSATTTLAAEQYGIEMVAAEVVLALSHLELSEGSGASEVTVTATVAGGALVEDLPVAVTVSGSDESGVVGFAPVAPFTLTVPSGHTSAAVVITVAPEDDYTDETDETVTVAGTAALTVAPATLTLVDDDATSTKLHWTISPLEIPEGAGPTEVTVSFRLDAAARTVDTELNGQATVTNLDDIHHPLGLEESHFEFNFSLPAGATTGTGVFVLTPVQDDFVENEETDPDDGVYIQFFPDVGEDVLASVPDDDLPLTSSGTKVILNLIDDDSLGPTATLTRCSSGSGSLVFIDFLDQDLNADPGHWLRAVGLGGGERHCDRVDGVG